MVNSMNAGAQAWPDSRILKSLTQQSEEVDLRHALVVEGPLHLFLAMLSQTFLSFNWS